MNSKAIGERTEGIVLGRLMSLGRVVLLPFGNNQRYDLVVDVGDGRFVRGQCKTARMNKKGDCLRFETCSTNGFTAEKRCYRGQIEVFWVYAQSTDKVYEVPVDAVGRTGACLRVAPSKGGPKSTIRWAKEFEL